MEEDAAAYTIRLLWLWAALHPSTAIATVSLKGTDRGSTTYAADTESWTIATGARSAETKLSAKLPNRPLDRFLRRALDLARWWACWMPSHTTFSILSASAAPRMRP